MRSLLLLPRLYNRGAGTVGTNGRDKGADLVHLRAIEPVSGSVASGCTLVGVGNGAAPRAGISLALAFVAAGCTQVVQAPSTTGTTELTSTTQAPYTTTTSFAETEPVPDPEFEVAVFRIEAGALGDSWRPGCPVSVDELRLMLVTHWDFDDQVRVGELIVHSEVAEDLTRVFRDLFTARFPIERMEPLQIYDSEDELSMAANNTSAFNCRRVTGGGGWSEHAFGRAVDINPVQNPYVGGSSILPPSGAAYLDRDNPRQGMVLEEGVVVRAFESVGWSWGGAWRSPDYQHFSESGR